FFFFQAEDGIRDGHVTGVQTCALPISIKRFVGRKLGEVSEEISMVPYKVVADDNGNARVEIRGKQFSPEEISAMILGKLKKSAEIGRASCREREESGVGGGALKIRQGR